MWCKDSESAKDSGVFGLGSSSSFDGHCREEPSITGVVLCLPNIGCPNTVNVSCRRISTVIGKKKINKNVTLLYVLTPPGGTETNQRPVWSSLRHTVDVTLKRLLTLVFNKLCCFTVSLFDLSACSCWHRLDVFTKCTADPTRSLCSKPHTLIDVGSDVCIGFCSALP